MPVLLGGRAGNARTLVVVAGASIAWSLRLWVSLLHGSWFGCASAAKYCCKVPLRSAAAKHCFNVLPCCCPCTTSSNRKVIQRPQLWRVAGRVGAGRPLPQLLCSCPNARGRCPLAGRCMAWQLRALRSCRTPRQQGRSCGRQGWLRVAVSNGGCMEQLPCPPLTRRTLALAPTPTVRPPTGGGGVLYYLGAMNCGGYVGVGCFCLFSMCFYVRQRCACPVWGYAH
jgi:hypothetical protein